HRHLELHAQGAGEEHADAGRPARQGDQGRAGGGADGHRYRALFGQGDRADPDTPAGMDGEVGVRLPPLADVDVDVEIDIADASLLGAMRAALGPWSLARLGIADMGEPQAAPLRQPAAALPCELPRQHDFLAAPVAADDMRAELAPAPIVAADD